MFENDFRQRRKIKLFLLWSKNTDFVLVFNFCLHVDRAG